MQIIKKRACKSPDEKEPVILFLQSLQESILKNLLKCPEKSGVYIKQGPRTTVFEIDIIQEDFGRLVGSKGKTIDALRVIVGAIAATNNIRAIVVVKDQDRFY